MGRTACLGSARGTIIPGMSTYVQTVLGQMLAYASDPGTGRVVPGIAVLGEVMNSFRAS